MIYPAATEAVRRPGGRLTLTMRLLSLALLTSSLSGAEPSPPLPSIIGRSHVFVAGESGYKAIRIPGVVAAYPAER